MNPKPLIAVHGLEVEIFGTPVVHGVSFEIPAGGAMALVGESGSGKTVTSRAMTGLLSRIGGKITKGQITFAGKDITAAAQADWHRLRGNDIALVPQASLSGLDPVIRIGNQLVETIRELDQSVDPVSRAIELLEQVQLRNPRALLRAYPHELSGGMRQRLMIALALAGRPQLVIADEPTTALDVTVQKEILKLLSELRAQTGMTLLMIAHDLAMVTEVAEDVAVMRSGRLVECGPVNDVFNQPSHPYTLALLAAQPDSQKKGEPLAVLNADSGELVWPEWESHPSPEKSSVLVEAQQISVTYAGAKTPALFPLDLRIESGSAIGIVGESGSGKSTLGKVLVGAQSFAGSLTIYGKAWGEIGNKDPLRRKVQMIFQDPYGSLTPWRTPRKIVAEVFHRWNAVSWQEALERAGELLHEVGLPVNAMDIPPTKLSGGQCQRVGIARALACDPEVLVADEPTSSLDISTQAQILNLILRLQAERGLALVLISHDLAVVRHMTDEALVMRNGKVVESGKCENVFNEPKHEYTRQLTISTCSIMNKNVA